MATILTTPRLELRHLVWDDLPALYALYQDPEVRQYFPEGTLSEAEAREELAWFLHGHPQHPALGLWATVHRPTGQFIGRCGLLPWTLDGQFEVEIAYLLAKPFWGQGLATEAAQAIRDYGFGPLGLTRLVCLIDAANSRSIGVATRIGMAYERSGTDEFGPYELYSMQRAQR